MLASKLFSFIEMHNFENDQKYFNILRCELKFSFLNFFMVPQKVLWGPLLFEAPESSVKKKIDLTFILIQFFEMRGARTVKVCLAIFQHYAWKC